MSIVLAADTAKIAEVEKKQFMLIEETFHAARLRELTTISSRELFDVRNERGIRSTVESPEVIS